MEDEVRESPSTQSPQLMPGELSAGQTCSDNLEAPTNGPTDTHCDSPLEEVFYECFDGQDDQDADMYQEAQEEPSQDVTIHITTEADLEKRAFDEWEMDGFVAPVPTAKRPQEPVDAKAAEGPQIDPLIAAKKRRI